MVGWKGEKGLELRYGLQREICGKRLVRGFRALW